MQSGVSQPSNEEAIKQGVGMLMKGPDQGYVIKATATDKESSPTCLHCCGPHKLTDCTDLTNAQIGELLVQLEIDDPDKGRILSQAKAGGRALRKNRLYLITCMTEDQMVTKEYLSRVHQSESLLKLHMNAGTSMTD